VTSAVRDAQQVSANTSGLGKFLHGPVNIHLGLAAHQRDNFDISPGNPFRPAGPKRLQYGFLGRPTPRKMLITGGPFLTVSNFLLGVDSLQKQLSMPLDHFPDAHDFHNVSTESSNHNRLSLGAPIVHRQIRHSISGAGWLVQRRTCRRFRRWSSSWDCTERL